MGEEQLGVVVFRLNQMESSIKEVNDKLDAILAHQQKYTTDIALVKQAQNQIEKRILVLENKLEKVQGESTHLQVSLAQKVGPHAITGAIVAGIMLLFKFFTGA